MFSGLNEMSVFSLSDFLLFQTGESGHFRNDSALFALSEEPKYDR